MIPAREVKTERFSRTEGRIAFHSGSLEIQPTPPPRLLCRARPELGRAECAMGTTPWLKRFPIGP